jgi:hypothetical protein
MHILGGFLPGEICCIFGCAVGVEDGVKDEAKLGVPELEFLVRSGY